MIWKFSSRKLNNLINNIHERFVRIISGDKESDFKTLLENYDQLTTHQQNLQALMIEVHKILNGYALPIMETSLYFEKMYTMLEIFR